MKTSEKQVHDAVSFLATAQKTDYTIGALLRTITFFWTIHCVKNVPIQSFSGPYFPAFGLISPHSFQVWENTDQKNLEYEDFYAVIIILAKSPEPLPSLKGESWFVEKFVSGFSKLFD